MSEPTATLEVLMRRRLLLQAHVPGDGFGNGDVQAAVQGVELLRIDGRPLLERELRDGLAYVAVIVDDLRVV